MRIRTRDREVLEGSILDIGRRWFLVHEIDRDHGGSDGFTAVRRKDLRSVTRCPQRRVMRRAWTRAGLPWPPAPPDRTVDLDSAASVVRDMSQLAQVIAVEFRGIGDELWLLRIQRTGTKLVTNVELTPKGRWKRHPKAFRLDSIRAISAGSHYASMLLDAADALPPRAQ